MARDNEEGIQSAADLVASQKSLMHQIHKAQRRTWFPLMVLALATFLAIPFERISHKSVGGCGAALEAGTLAPHYCRIYSFSGFFYWPIALTLSYLAISVFYRTQTRKIGAQTSAKTFVLPGALIGLALSALSYLLYLITSRREQIFGFNVLDPTHSIIYRVLSPAFSVGLALFFLARAESNRLLLLFTVTYCVAVLWQPLDGIHLVGFWSLAPYRVIDGTLLILFSVTFFLLQRVQRGKNGR
jgi:hypothetical protein